MLRKKFHYHYEESFNNKKKKLLIIFYILLTFRFSNFHVFFLITSTSSRDYFFSLFRTDFRNTICIVHNEIGRRGKRKRKRKENETIRFTFSKMGVRIVHVIFMIDDGMQRVIYLVWGKIIVRLFHVPRATTGRYDFPVENTVADTSEHVTTGLTWKVITNKRDI